MKTVTVEQFKSFGPCWLETREGRERFSKVASLHDEWTAYDVLALEEVSARDKLRLVLRKEFIDVPVLHEYACRCAEYALSLIDNPDTRSVAAIEAKRKWLRGEIDNSALDAARDAAWDAVRAGARSAVRAAALAAARDAARPASRSAALAASRSAALAAFRSAALAAEHAAVMDYEAQKLINILVKLLNESYGGKTC